MSRSRVRKVPKECSGRRRKEGSQKSLESSFWAGVGNRRLKMRMRRIAAGLEGLLLIYLKKKSRYLGNRKISLI